MRHRLFLSAALALAATPALAQEPLRPDQASFRALYKELVETNTTLSAGSCTVAAERMGARLKAAGYADGQITYFSTPEHPKEGGLVAVLPGADPKAKAILLLAHVDVVEAKREDWTRDPFTLIEEGGYFYARGAADDKAQAAIYTDTMIRLKAEPKLKRTLKLALTCGEETNGAFNGAQWLSKNRRELIDAAFALNEGGGGRLEADGKARAMGIQVAEKTSQDYQLETRNPGGHSSVPKVDNAIYELAQALVKVQAYTFPVHLNPVTTEFFRRSSKLAGAPPAMAKAMGDLSANPQDEAANRLLSADPTLRSMLRTTCVATLLEGGHAQNALPQRARANINCRIAPGETIAGTNARLAEVIGDPKVTVTTKPGRDLVGTSPPLDPAVLGPAETVLSEMYPGLPLIPTMSTGATDSTYMTAVGIPGYGVPGMLSDADGSGVHGLNERIRTASVYKGRDYLFKLIKLYASK